MKTMNYKRYKQYPVMELKDRTWPDKQITKAPVWCSVDLRDGNQALENPMTIEQKAEMFQMLVDIGFKEIEVGFPSAAAVEFDFMRKLIDDNLIPDDVTVQVLTQAREHLIRRTFDSLKGAQKAIIHLYNSTSVNQREVVFRKSREEIKQIAINGARLVKQLGDEQNNPGIRYEYSPESFTGTEMDYALEVCNAVIEVFQPTPDNPLIINLPATVEMATPNVYADQIEWFDRNLASRDSIQISLHTHNDRGTGIAASELAVMAGADRVEGTLFGNGERTGNLDLMTMALNIFSQGIDPELDFSEINKIRDTYCKTTGMDVHARHPYAGDLVYTAFSGSHQDAINKGMAVRTSKEHWDVPYLPIDPEDVGRTYESIVRINSQSGKGGVAYIMENNFGYKLPKKMHPEFGTIIQKVTEEARQEIDPNRIMENFQRNYLQHESSFSDIHISMDTPDGADTITKVSGHVTFKEDKYSLEGTGNGPIDAFINGLMKGTGLKFSLESYDEHAIGSGSDTQAVAYIGLKTEKKPLFYGVGIDPNISLASFKAILSALSRL